MSETSRIVKVGTRGSKLARLQTSYIVGQMARLLPEVRWEDVPVGSPGDRDRDMDLRESPADFFTRDLDQAVRDGTLDCAIHSAKDVPDPIGEGLDWFWFPWREDPRDALIRPRGRGMADMPADGRIGVSSARREAYCRARFPRASLLPVRGDIEDRLRQLDAGAFDLLVMAGAALTRLGLTDRIGEWISTDALPAPDGQGALALTFRAGDRWFTDLRGLFVKAVTFAAAGVGSAGACTLDSLAALKRCDVVLHDTLFGHELLDRLPPSVRRVDVGKRAGRHGRPQEETTRLIAATARQGLRVVRLKGGDPGIFGRLAEEIAALDELNLPYRVLPGVSSLSSATTGTGMLLTRRGVSRGFTVMTPREAGGAVGSVGAEVRRDLPLVFFMATSVAGEVVRQLLADGNPAATPAAVVYGAGGDQCRVVSGDLATIVVRMAEAASDMPGVLIVGEAARHRYRGGGALGGRRVLLTGSEALQDRAAGLLADYGGIAVCRPLIRMRATPAALGRVRDIASYEWVVLTSPSAARHFGEALAQAQVDLRRVPGLASCGGGTSRELRRLGLGADVEPAAGFGAEGLLAALRSKVVAGTRILRLRSDRAGSGMADALRACGAVVDDCVLYRNEPVRYPTCPDFDAVFFASASAVDSFASAWGSASLADRVVLAIGKPTLEALRALGVEPDLVSSEATVEACLEALAEYCVRKELCEQHAGDLS